MTAFACCECGGPAGLRFGFILEDGQPSGVTVVFVACERDPGHASPSVPLGDLTPALAKEATWQKR